MAEVFDAQRFAVLKRFCRAYSVQAAEQLPQSVQLIEIARLRGTATPARKQGEAKACVFEQALAVVNHGGNDRDFAVGQLEGETVFFKDRFVGPALRPIKLGNQRFRVFDADLIHAVFVAIECEHAGIAQESDAFDGIEYQIWGKCCKRMRHADSCAQQAAASGHAC